jgi:hypothetical protein
VDFDLFKKIYYMTSKFVIIILQIVYAPGSRDSSVGIETGYGLDDRGVGFRIPIGSKNFSSLGRPDGV